LGLGLVLACNWPGLSSGQAGFSHKSEICMHADDTDLRPSTSINQLVNEFHSGLSNRDCYRFR